VECCERWNNIWWFVSSVWYTSWN